MAFYLALYLLPFRQERWHSGPREPVDTQGGYLAHLDLASSLRACLRRPHSLALWTALGRQITNRLRARLWRCVSVYVRDDASKQFSRISAAFPGCARACREAKEDSCGYIRHWKRQETSKALVQRSISWAKFVCWLNRGRKENKVRRGKWQQISQRARKGSAGDSLSFHWRIPKNVTC